MIKRNMIRVVVLAALAGASARASVVGAADGNPILIPSNGVATPYPATITISNPSLSNQVVSSVTVTLRGFTHTFPDDVDVVLESPSGLAVPLMSDTGGSSDVNMITLGFDDNAATSLPDSTALSTGTNRPTDVGTGDTMPAPALPPSVITNLAGLIGSKVTGTWKLYVNDDAASDAGAFSNGWSLSINTVDEPPPRVIISEFRLRGTNGPNDEYVELYNNSDYPCTVQSVDTSAGWTVASRFGAYFLITNGTILPARGHFLAMGWSNSLTGYLTGPAGTSGPDRVFNGDMDDNVGIGLFRTAMSANRSVSNVLDAVGPVGELPLYKEGTGYAPIMTNNSNYAFVRKMATGFPQDTDDNARDFLLVDADGAFLGTGQRLGAPGPENSSSPIRQDGHPLLVWSLVDPNAGVTGAPNRVRNAAPGPVEHSENGTLSIRRKITNLSPVNIRWLRFRIVDMTTFSIIWYMADLRAITSTNILVDLTTGGSVPVVGTELDVPPRQKYGGGYNASLTVTSVTPNSVIAPGGSRNVQFLFGLNQTNQYRFMLVPETIPAMPTEALLVVGDTESVADQQSDGGDIIQDVRVEGTNIVVGFSSSPMRRYQLQRTSQPLDHYPFWTDVGALTTGQYTSTAITNLGGAIGSNLNYRVIATP